MHTALQLSNVPAGTANELSFVMLGLIAISLLAGPALIYIYWNKLRKSKAPQELTGQVPPPP